MHLLLPSLLWPAGVKEIASRRIRPKHIEKLFSRANRTVVHGGNFTETLFSLFGLEAQLEQDLPVGAVSLYGHGVDPGEDCWAVATPVYLKADRDNLLLAGPSFLDIDQRETEQFVDIFNNHFKEDGLVLIQISTTEWFLKLTQCPSISTSCLESVVGRHIEGYLPVGTDAQYWRSVINETQMLFFQSEVSQQMIAAGKTPVNSLWISGFGHLPKVESQFSAVYSSLSMVAGLAKLSNISYQRIPISIDDLAITDDNVLIALTELFEAELSLNMDKWIKYLQFVDSKVSVLWKKLGSLGGKEMTIYPCNGFALNVSRFNHTMKFWRKNKILAQI